MKLRDVHQIKHKCVKVSGEEGLIDHIAEFLSLGLLRSSFNKILKINTIFSKPCYHFQVLHCGAWSDHPMCTVFHYCCRAGSNCRKGSPVSCYLSSTSQPVHRLKILGLNLIIRTPNWHLRILISALWLNSNASIFKISSIFLML